MNLLLVVIQNCNVIEWLLEEDARFTVYEVGERWQMTFVSTYALQG